MSVTLVNPAELPTIDVYHQVAIAKGTSLVFTSGQVAWNAPGADFPTQVEDTYLNVATALAAAGATFDDVVKVTAYVVDWTPSMMPELLEGIARASAKLGTTPKAPATLIGVAALDVPEHRVEIEAIAVL